MRTLYRLFGLLVFTICGLTSTAWATHVRAGEITSRRISSTSLTYELTLTIYCDWAQGRPATEGTAGTGVKFCFGDGTPVQNTPLFTQGLPSGGIVDVGNSTVRLIFRTTHTFSAPGTYTVSVGIDNRNKGTLNITNNRSDEYPFFVESTLAINAFLGLNSTPVMLNPPVDFEACAGQRYIHNPSAFDADGDSLAYRLTQNKSTLVGESCNGFVIPSIVYPNDIPNCNDRNEANNGPAGYSINSVTGDLIWDAPTCPGQYNVAFIIEEWRSGVKIGEITRDMQIIVRDCQNKRPTLEAPDEICVEAGSTATFNVRATDPDGNRLTITSTSGVYQQSSLGINLIQPPFATFTTPTQPQASPATGTFSWQTNCTHLRQLPYEVLFKVRDHPGSVQPYLTDSKTVKVRVVAPAPKNLRSEPSGPGYVLNWDAYPCQITGAQIVIYRRQGCVNLTPDLCKPGPPPGYVEVGRVPITQTTYTDNSSGLRPNTEYSYRLVASFPGPNNLTRFNSTFSNQACQRLPNQALYITNVTVDETSTTQGQITVKWTRPEGAGARQYRIFRTTGLNGTAYTQVGTINTNLSAPRTNDTIYVDRGLNTEANAYRYRVDVFNGTTRQDSSQAASSVRLSGSGQSRAVQLSWQANVPWSNDNQTHRIYRQVRPGVYNLIQQVAVQGPGTYTYTDNGRDNVTSDGDISTTLSADSTYCYRVETVGTYGDPSIHSGLLYNFSQRLCLTPTDTTRPCPPVLTLDQLDCATYVQGICETGPYSNRLSWTDATTGPNGAACDPNIVQYNIYYKRYGDTGDFEKIGETKSPPSRNFTHDNLGSYAGCYYVTSVNRFGTESVPSNTVCKDNCPDYSLPNVITPNSDGKNDTFEPIRCPRFVKNVRFRVYNRWGVKVFESNDNVLIQWDGRTDAGKELAAGTYYYEAQVTYERLNRADENRPVILKSWVQIIR
ncbi:hypothetical protein BWI93_06965 [Siphonobacter sp. BAB-5385]|uniref:T9SS type B sorting domain-containing protein n=1 Tax=unclassified Siphonobacter TaxID=2635712 RepID=UPI000B9EA167|nr:MULTISPECIES: gliding motility-associated C-terminal domain-containing protein [unclassified Siphonobacter]OZI08960.1 hypothetical protein BWI93_06965 [Siphonobacter sp. BAB-5385]PMD96595.1 hypothetical protein BWI97_10455 [Siphonobacter sp. BAB-5405]